MKFENSELTDLDEIFRLYDAVIEFQKTVFHKSWLPFERELIEREIAGKRNWKIVSDDGKILCVFSLAFEDPLIWGAVAEPSIFLHRVAVDPAKRGLRLFPIIVEWLKVYGRERSREFIRMDTWSDNQKLTNYYVGCGFDYIGIVAPSKPEEMPKHYEGITLGLFEMKI